MRRHGIRRALTFNADFAAEGFEVLPPRESRSGMPPVDLLYPSHSYSR
jgi:hypothetical protein